MMTISTRTSDSITEEGLEGLSFLQPSFDLESQLTREDIISMIEKDLARVLSKRFSQRIKQEILRKPGRLNFACPYCGDSAQDLWKKRANIYHGGFNFHCYNCGKHATYPSFAKDFGIELGSHEASYIREEHKKSYDASFVPSTNLSFVLPRYEPGRWGIDRDLLVEKLGAADVTHGPMQLYLSKRLISSNLERFAWNHRTQQLYIFNLVDTQVIGYQIRNFKTTPKYLTFKLSKIYKDILGKDVPTEDSEFNFVDRLSNIFGIYNLELHRPITAFEGPLDSFLVRNAVATCSVENDFPFDVPVRWVYDCDAAGKKAGLKKISQGCPVFLWKRYLDDCGLDINRSKKIDFTDIQVLAARKGIILPPIDTYFSTTHYDGYWL